MALGVTQVKGVHDKAYVGGILAGLAHMGDLDQLEVGFVHGRLETLVAVPVAIGLLDDNAALEEQAFENELDVELFVARIAHAQGHVLEITEQGHADIFGG